MSWSIQLAGKPADIVAGLQAESAKLTGASLAEYNVALPSLVGLVQQNTSPIILEANGHAGTSGTPPVTYSNCNVNIRALGFRLAESQKLASVPTPPATDPATKA